MLTWLHSPKTQKTLKQVAEIKKGLAHKAFNPESKAHQKFVASLRSKIKVLEKEFPFMEF